DVDGVAAGDLAPRVDGRLHERAHIVARVLQERARLRARAEGGLFEVEIGEAGAAALQLRECVAARLEGVDDRMRERVADVLDRSPAGCAGGEGEWARGRG